MATTYRSEELGKDIEISTIVIEDLDFETVTRDKARVGEGDKAKTVHTINVLGSVYQYDSKRDRNSDYYRLKNQVERAQKSETQGA